MTFHTRRSAVARRSRRTVLGLACAWAAVSPPDARACSPVRFPLFRDGVHLVGTATPETVRAGAGRMEYVVDPGGPDPDPGSVGGQVVRVERVGGSEAAGLPSGVDRVVLVPWGYGLNCGAVRWTGGAAWVAPGVRGLFWAALRPREHWVDGLPTLDVAGAYHLPYLDTGSGVPDEEERAGPPLSVDQAFEIIGLLPLRGEHQADEQAAGRPLLDWARAHPGLARRYPASVLVRQAVHGHRSERLKRIRPPLAGTYRLTVTVDGGAPRTFYARSRTAPDEEWSPGEDFESQPTLDEPIRGYSLRLTASAVPDSFPAVGGSDEEVDPVGFVPVLAEPDAGPGAARLWRGTVELSLVARQFPDDPVLGTIGDAALERYLRRAHAREPEEILARFLLRPDGSVAVEQTSVLDDRARGRHPRRAHIHHDPSRPGLRSEERAAGFWEKGSPVGPRYDDENLK